MQKRLRQMTKSCAPSFSLHCLQPSPITHRRAQDSSNRTKFSLFETALALSSPNPAQDSPLQPNMPYNSQQHCSLELRLTTGSGPVQYRYVDAAGAALAAGADRGLEHTSAHTRTEPRTVMWQHSCSTDVAYALSVRFNRDGEMMTNPPTRREARIAPAPVCYRHLHPDRLPQVLI